VAEMIDAILEQYDKEDFDLGIKQFMIEQVRTTTKAVRKNGERRVPHTTCVPHAYGMRTIITRS